MKPVKSQKLRSPVSLQNDHIPLMKMNDRFDNCQTQAIARVFGNVAATMKALKTVSTTYPFPGPEC